MKVSFVIPAYNEEKYIAECLKSIYELDGLEDFEVIVADNGSTDRTREVTAARFPHTNIVIEERKGANWARQKGYREASGELIVFFDADVRVPKWWYRRMMKYFSRDSRLIAFSGPYMFTGFSILYHIWENYIYNFILAPAISRFFGTFFHTPIFFGGNVAVRRSALEKIGGFDTSYRFYADDTNLGRRLSGVGKARFIPRLFVYASNRRMKKEGTLKTFYYYTINFLWEAIFHKPFTR